MATGALAYRAVGGQLRPRFRGEVLCGDRIFAEGAGHCMRIVPAHTWAQQRAWQRPLQVSTWRPEGGGVRLDLECSNSSRAQIALPARRATTTRTQASTHQPQTKKSSTARPTANRHGKRSTRLSSRRLSLRRFARGWGSWLRLRIGFGWQEAVLQERSDGLLEGSFNGGEANAEAIDRALLRE